MRQVLFSAVWFCIYAFCISMREIFVESTDMTSWNKLLQIVGVRGPHYLATNRCHCWTLVVVVYVVIVFMVMVMGCQWSEVAVTDWRRFRADRATTNMTRTNMIHTNMMQTNISFRKHSISVLLCSRMDGVEKRKVNQNECCETLHHISKQSTNFAKLSWDEYLTAGISFKKDIWLLRFL